MKKLFTARIIATILVISLAGGVALANAYYAYPVLRETTMTLIADDKMSIREKTLAFEDAVNAEFFRKNDFIEIYGLSQRMMEKNEMKNFSIAKDEHGSMHYVYFQTAEHDVTAIGDSMVRLKNSAEKSGAECLMLMPPSKIIKGYTSFETGLPVPDENKNIDDFLAYLTAHDVDNFDLRETMASSGIPPEKQFFKTDHHWTVESAFWAFTQTVDYLETTYDMSLDPEKFYTDIDNYNQILYENAFLGSMGRTVGYVYGDVDDFDLIYPKFGTEFSYTSSNGDKEMIALFNTRFEQALLTLSIFADEHDIMDIHSDKYFAYLAGNYGFAQITNHDKPDGERILFIKDSYCVPVAAFLATTCAEVDLIDPRWYGDDILEYVEKNNYDAVIMMLSPQNLTEEFFHFK